jgi:hypothetical protein
MITTETPNKLAEIIHDTWPNLYRVPKDWKSPTEYKKSNIIKKES